MRRAVVALLAARNRLRRAAAHGSGPGGRAAAPAIGAVDGRGAAARPVRVRARLDARTRDGHGGRDARDALPRRRLAQLGLEPAGDSGFVQRVPMQKEVFGPETRIAVEEGGASRPLTIGTDVVPLLNLGAGVPPTKRIADGEIVFVGYGLTTGRTRSGTTSPDSRSQGKVVVVVNGAPAGVDSAQARTSSRGRRRSASGSRRSCRSDPRR